MRIAVFVVVGLALACGGGGEGAVDAGADVGADVDAGGGGAVAVFDLDALAAGVVTSVPFPSDLYRDERGTIVLREIPGVRDRPAFDAIRRLARAREGFCTTCAVTFAIEGALDPASVPGSARPGDVAALADPILLVDVDPRSPERGRLFPLRVHYAARAGRLVARPTPGHVLARRRQYAAVLTDALRAADGSPLRAPVDFLAARDGDGGPTEPGARARALLAPVFEALEGWGVARGRVVAATVFTTGDATRELAQAHALVGAAPAPVVTVERVLGAEELDDLLGVPADEGPGIDGPPAPGTEGARAIAHGTAGVVLAGTFSAPRLVTGTGTDVGVPRRDAGGELEAGPLEAVPFVLAVPAGAPAAGMPVVVSLHGFNASRVTGFALLDTAGRAGAAMLSIDYFQHGERAASAVDELHAMRGDLPGPDGFAENSAIDVSARVFGLSGVAPGTELSPEYALASVLQFAADAMATVRLVREGDLGPVVAAAPELAGLSFDPERVFVVGNSLGAEVTTLLASVERRLAGIVLDVWPGSLVDNLVDSPEFRPLTESVFLPQLGLRGPYDEPSRGLDVELVVDLYRWALEPVDPLALAPHVLRDPIEANAGAPDVLVQLGGLDEVASRRASEAAVAALGVPATPALTLAPADETTGPVTANLDVPGGPVTAVCSWLAEGGHGMMELRAQESRYAPPALPPFERRPDPVPVTNPITEVHAQIERLVRTRTPTTRATLP